MPRIIWGQAIDKGLIRSTNEDALFAWSLVSQTEKPISMGLFIVADGFGGGRAGIQAANIAINVTNSFLMQTVITPLLLETAYPIIPDVIAESIHTANSEIIRQQKLDPGLLGMGSTIDVALVVNRTVYTGHVGDSKIFVVKEDSIQRITDDHTFFYKLIKSGEMTIEQLSEQLNTTTIGNILHRMLGMTADLEVDTDAFDLDPNSCLLLCTDGLTRLSIIELPERVTNIVRTVADPQLACEQLIEYANSNGGEDNTAVILVKVMD